MTDPIASCLAAAETDSAADEEEPHPCQFLVDYQTDEATWGDRRLYRYRWSEEVHEEVLARLLDLNQKLYAEEVTAGLRAEKGAKTSGPRRRHSGRGPLRPRTPRHLSSRR